MSAITQHLPARPLTLADPVLSASNDAGLKQDPAPTTHCLATHDYCTVKNTVSVYAARRLFGENEQLLFKIRSNF